MKKSIVFTAFAVLFFFFANATHASAFSFSNFFTSIFGKSFGGYVVGLKAPEIKTLENEGYVCAENGTSLSVLPLSSKGNLTPAEPVGYFLPKYLTSKTDTMPEEGNLIMGKYSGKTLISCVLEYPPDTQTVELDTVYLFGISKK